MIKPNISGIAWNDEFILVKREKDSEIGYSVIDVKEDKIYQCYVTKSHMFEIY